MKPNRKKWPNLAKAWDEYGHGVKFEDLFDMKVATTHCYVALAWIEKDGEEEWVNYADLASADNGKTWEMQNDGHEFLTKKQWREARVKPDCDWLELKGEMV